MILLCLQAILRASAARTRGHRQGLLLLLSLPHLRDCVHYATNESDENSADRPKRNWSIEEDKTRQGDGELVQRADHGVRSRRSDAHAPRRCVGDEDGRQAGDEHGSDDVVARFWREVLRNVGTGPVLEEDGAGEEDGDGEKVVVEHCYIQHALALDTAERRTGIERILNALSKSLKLVSLMRFLMPSTYVAVQKQFSIIHT